MDGVPAHAVVLNDALHRRVFVADGIVHRPFRPWTPTIQRLLLQLHADGHDFTPEPLGYDDRWELLRFVPGRSGGQGWQGVLEDRGLRKFGQLLRSLHDALVSYPTSSQDRWALPAEASFDRLVHNDFGPWNVVWRDDDPVAVLDWDFVAPGDPIDDVAYALRYVAPFETDEHARSWMHHESRPNRRRRIEVFLDAYGLELDLREVPALVAERCRLTTRHVRHLAAIGIQPQVDWVEAGTDAADTEHASWIERNGPVLLES